eukprot:g15449.t1
MNGDYYGTTMADGRDMYVAKAPDCSPQWYGLANYIYAHRKCTILAGLIITSSKPENPAYREASWRAYMRNLKWDSEAL